MPVVKVSEKAYEQLSITTAKMQNKIKNRKISLKDAADYHILGKEVE